MLSTSDGIVNLTQEATELATEARWIRLRHLVNWGLPPRQSPLPILRISISAAGACFVHLNGPAMIE